MFRSHRLSFLAGSLMLAALFGVCSLPQAQGQGKDKGEKVRFTTVDGVELHGMFYASSKRNAPTIMMLHALEQDSRKKAWVSLAETLNNKGFSVLTFDFRGHGQSTELDPAEFWKWPANASLVKGAPKKASMEVKDMKSAYYPVLVNDIAAAKAFLDHRNDAGSCNTASTILIGAETGATLGALWLNSEWHRYRFTPPDLAMFMPAQIAKVPEGKDVIAAIWLSATTKLGTRPPVLISKLVEVPAKENATPMVFMYGDGDTTGKTVAKIVEKTIKGAKNDKKYPYTAAVEVAGGAKLTGVSLLQKSLGTENAIVEYIQNVVEAKGQEWGERDFRKSQYVWRIPGTSQPLPAKLPMEKTLVYDTYERFMPR